MLLWICIFLRLCRSLSSAVCELSVVFLCFRKQQQVSPVFIVPSIPWKRHIYLNVDDAVVFRSQAMTTSYKSWRCDENILDLCWLNMQEKEMEMATNYKIRTEVSSRFGEGDGSLSAILFSAINTHNIIFSCLDDHAHSQCM